MSEVHTIGLDLAKSVFQVRKHIKAALSLLGRNGHDEPAVLVALVPITYEHEDAETLETLPEDTFSTCTIRTKIIRIVK